MKFIDRKKEKERLERSISSIPTGLTVVYGRRRIGKSTLLRRVIKNNDIYFLADRSEASHQREVCAKIIAEKIEDFDKVSYPDWEILLTSLNHRVMESFCLCLDEFPYLVEQSPELPSVLQKLLDEKILKYNLLICGSSQNMMYGLVFDKKSPLYGRAKEIIKLIPLKLPFIEEALHIDGIDAIKEYAVWGGIPRYWELRENCKTFESALWDNVFSINGILYDEPNQLLQDDMKDIVKASTILSFIASGANRISEIASRSGEVVTNLSRPVSKLVELGLIAKEMPFGVDEKNSKKTLYKISDQFLGFYYRFVVPNISFINLDRRKPIEANLQNGLNDFISSFWEKVCREAVTGNEIYGKLYGKASRWWGSVKTENGIKHCELDVVAESLDGKSILVGECKWTNPEIASVLIKELNEKISFLPFCKGKEVIPVLFLKNRPKDYVKTRNFKIFFPNDIIELSKK
ncbi:MAG: ATP-binding protein [Muribaculaceae bacterium]|nr:ATP-binding protein [Muribaculaceae bacterium]